MYAQLSPHRVRFGSVEFDIANRALDYAALGDGFVDLLRAHFADTYETCEYHRRRFDRAGVRPEQIQTLADFRRVPVLYPGDVGATSELSLLPDRYRAALRGRGLGDFAPGERIKYKFNTSGSTGRPKATYYTFDDWAANVAGLQRAFAHVPREACSKAYLTWAGGLHGFSAFTDVLTASGGVVEWRHHAAVTDDQVVRQMSASWMSDAGHFNCLVVPPCRPPGVLTDKGGTLDGMLNADVDNYIGRHIRVIFTGGAPRDLPAFRLRERIAEANALARTEPTMLVDISGATEVSCTFAECERNDGLHLQFGNAFVEVLREGTLEPVRDGERGLLVCTSFKQGSRYVRYAIGDEATFVATPCPCGRVTPRVRDIVRILDTSRLQTGCAAG